MPVASPGTNSSRHPIVSAPSPPASGQKRSPPESTGNKTRDKLGIAVWDYLGSRLKVAENIIVQPLDR
jgi:hypothetical protein